MLAKVKAKDNIAIEMPCRKAEKLIERKPININNNNVKTLFSFFWNAKNKKHDSIK